MGNITNFASSPRKHETELEMDKGTLPAGMQGISSPNSLASSQAISWHVDRRTACLADFICVAAGETRTPRIITAEASSLKLVR